MEAVKSKKNHKLLTDVRILVWRDSGEERSEEAEKYFEREAPPYYDPYDWNTDKRDFYPCPNEKWKFKKDRIFLHYRAPAGDEPELNYIGIHRIVSPDNQYHKVGNEYIVLYYEEIDCKNFIFKPSEQEELQQSLIEYLNNKKDGWEPKPDGNILDRSLLEFVNHVHKS